MLACRFSLWLFLLVTGRVVQGGFLIPSKQRSRRSLFIHQQTKKETKYESSLLWQQPHEQEQDNDCDGSSLHHSSSRRDMLRSVISKSTGVAAIATATTTAMLSGISINPANAVGLVQFPCHDGTLMNNYHFMRAGQSLLESNNLWGTNPMFLTNRVDNSLSSEGKQQVSKACDIIRHQTINSDISQVKFPLAANAMDTAKQLKEELLIPGNLVVPEYTYLDQRGIGSWDMFPMDTTEEGIWALDYMESGKEGRGGLPPPNNDGTPNETLYNQVTRLRQLISITETYNSGDTVLFVFPDGTGPALLSCLIAGIPLNRVHELQYAPGEVRTDITYDSVRSSLPTQPTMEYMEAIQRGKIELERLRIIDNQNPKTPTGYVTHRASRTDDSREQPTTPEEQIVKRQQQYEAAAANRAKEHEESKTREKKQQQQRDDKKRIEIATQNQQRMENAYPTQLSFLSLGLAACLATFRPPPKEDHQVVEVDSSERTTGSIAQQKTANGDTSIEDLSEDIAVGGPPSSSSDSVSSTKYPELQVLEDLTETASFDIPEYGRERNSQQQQQQPVASSQIRRQRDEKQLVLEAEKAMDDYLNQDDGGMDYDSWMAQLLLEDDEA